MQSGNCVLQQQGKACIAGMQLNVDSEDVGGHCSGVAGAIIASGRLRSPHQRSSGTGAIPILVCMHGMKCVGTLLLVVRRTGVCSG